MGWISVKDRLPNPKDMDNIRHLVSEKSINIKSNKSFLMSVARWNGEEWICGGRVLNNVTHWQPLPELPKSE